VEDRAVSVGFCGLQLAHPIVNGSGTFDAIAAWRAFGDELLEDFPFAAYVSKTITLRPRAGNPPPRLWEAPAGLINSIGLPNKGLHGYLREDLPRLAELAARARTRVAVDVPDGAGSAASIPLRRTPVAVDVPDGAGSAASIPLVTNVMGSSARELAELVSACDAREEIAAIELNVSCPNVGTGLDIGADPPQLREVVRDVRACTGKPLIVKLTPNTADVPACALAAQDGGADAVSLINTLRATALAPARVGDGRSPWLGGGTGGLSGPAIRAVALAQVAAVAACVQIPVVGMGGVQSADHARDMLDVGATLVAVGTESFRDPAAGARIARGLRRAPAAH
jgi:dihydroorotate dehydrogenase (NAD+) catalytic subunit